MRRPDFQELMEGKWRPTVEDLGFEPRQHRFYSSEIQGLKVYGHEVREFSAHLLLSRKATAKHALSGLLDLL